MTDSNKITSKSGCPIADIQNSLTAGNRGPLLMQDFQLMEEMQSFNRERIPERVVHAKGSGAYGTFTLTRAIPEYTKAQFLTQEGQKTDIFARFSTVAGEKGAADAERDVRGFAVKFYTPQGNWDMVGNNTPVFFIRDPYKFANFIHTQKRHPQTNLRNNNSQWDFWSLNPESLHQVTILFSDRGLPASYRHMNGYGSHTFSFINDKNERVWCKFHFKTRQGNKSITAEESTNLIGIDRESHQRDLFYAIDRGEYPSWTVKIQIMTQTQAQTFSHNPFDLTKVWPHQDYPLMEIGILELNRNPENYFAEVEQSAFSPSVFVPGIGPSPDKVLQARLMSYPDAQRYRIGTNYHQLPINKPQCPVMHYQRDGAMSSGHGGSSPNYYPNSDDNAPKEAPEYAEPPLNLGNVAVDRYDSREGNDDYSQAGNLWRIFSEAQKERTAKAIASSMNGITEEIKMRQLCHFFRADMEYGQKVANALGITIDATKFIAK